MTWSQDNPRFTVGLTESGKWVINDMDFGYDAVLALSGDFIDNHGEHYARYVADVLNRNREDIPVAPDNYNDGHGLL